MRLIGNVTKEINMQYNHWVPVSPLTWTDMNLPKYWVQKTYTTTMTVQTIMKDALVVIPLKMLTSSLIFLEQIMLNTYMNTNKLNTTDR